MTLSEFKAWFEGFTENISAQPTKKQWARINERVAEIDEMPMPAPIFIDRYVRPYPTYWPPYTCTATGGSIKDSTSNVTAMMSNTAFQTAGRAEAQAMG